jgi:hypothetical protein
MARKISDERIGTTVLLSEKHKDIIKRYSLTLSDFIRRNLEAFDNNPKKFAKFIDESLKKEKQ